MKKFDSLKEWFQDDGVLMLFMNRFISMFGIECWIVMNYQLKFYISKWGSTIVIYKSLQSELGKSVFSKLLIKYYFRNLKVHKSLRLQYSGLYFFLYLIENLYLGIFVMILQTFNWFSKIQYSVSNIDN